MIGNREIENKSENESKQIEKENVRDNDETFYSKLRSSGFIEEIKLFNFSVIKSRRMFGSKRKHSHSNTVTALIRVGSMRPMFGTKIIFSKVN